MQIKILPQHIARRGSRPEVISGCATTSVGGANNSVFPSRRGRCFFHQFRVTYFPVDLRQCFSSCLHLSGQVRPCLDDLIGQVNVFRIGSGCLGADIPGLGLGGLPKNLWNLFHTFFRFILTLWNLFHNVALQIIALMLPFLRRFPHRRISIGHFVAQNRKGNAPPFKFAA